MPLEETELKNTELTRLLRRLIKEVSKRKDKDSSVDVGRFGV